MDTLHAHLMPVSSLVYLMLDIQYLVTTQSALIFALYHYFQNHPNGNPMSMIFKIFIILNSREKWSWLRFEALGSAEIMRTILSKFN